MARHTLCDLLSPIYSTPELWVPVLDENKGKLIVLFPYPCK